MVDKCRYVSKNLLGSALKDEPPDKFTAEATKVADGSLVAKNGQSQEKRKVAKNRQNQQENMVAGNNQNKDMNVETKSSKNSKDGS